MRVTLVLNNISIILLFSITYIQTREEINEKTKDAESEILVSG
jgi:hypothetical protein